MFFCNNKIGKPLTAKKRTSSAETEREAKEKRKTRVSWTVGQVLL